jgi:cellulase/cellobiase CelA1
VLSTEDRPNSYYGNAWRLFGLLLMTGNFPNLYEKAAGTSPEPPPGPVPPPPPPSPPPSPSLSCRVSYTIVTQWNTGFQANIVVTNQSSAPVAGYTLLWNFAAGESINSGWNANYAQSGSSVTASNPANNWNGTIGAGGGSVAFGFIGNGVGRVPARFTLNNNVCQSP